MTKKLGLISTMRLEARYLMRNIFTQKGLLNTKMNKLVIFVIFLLLVIGGSVFYRQVFLAGKICSAEEGSDVTWDLRSLEQQWEFDPPVLEVKKCDRVTLNIYNEDEYDHGFAIDVFGVNQRIDPQTTTKITFTASQPGEHTFYCSVPCGEGHFRHKGTIIVTEVTE